MSQVHTVLGPVAPEAIGPTDSHEHLFIRGGMPVLRFPDFHLVEYDRIAQDAVEFKNAGGSAIVEMSPIDWGRDVAQMVRLARQFNLHIIAATGFHKVFYYSDSHWIYSYDEADIAQLICDELLLGMDVHNYTGPIIQRAAARAGVIKVGTQTGALSAIEQKLLRAVALAHSRTGAPIVTHTDEGQLALEQVEFLTGLGVAPGRIALSHLDRRLDFEYHRDLAERGVYLEYDALTRVGKGFNRSTRDLVIRMVEAGFAQRLLLGGDISRQSYWHGYGGEPGLRFLMDGFRSQLSEHGLTDADIDTIYVRNPRSLLAWSEARP